jgi:hypothetical protein
MSLASRVSSAWIAAPVKPIVRQAKTMRSFMMLNIKENKLRAVAKTKIRLI